MFDCDDTLRVKISRLIRARQNVAEFLVNSDKCLVKSATWREVKHC